MIRVEATFGCEAPRLTGRIGDELRRRLAGTVNEPPPAELLRLAEALERRLAEPEHLLAVDPPQAFQVPRRLGSWQRP